MHPEKKPNYKTYFDVFLTRFLTMNVCISVIVRRLEPINHGPRSYFRSCIRWICMVLPLPTFTWGLQRRAQLRLSPRFPPSGIRTASKPSASCHPGLRPSYITTTKLLGMTGHCQRFIYLVRTYHPFASNSNGLTLESYRITVDLSFPPSKPNFVVVNGEPAFDAGPERIVNIAKQLAGHLG